MTVDLMSTPAACSVAGCSFRQADHWDRTGTVLPTVPARGSGSQRRYNLDGVRSLRLAALLSAHGSAGDRSNGFAGPIIAQAVVEANSAGWVGFLFIGDEGVGVAETAADALDASSGALVTLVILGLVVAHVDAEVALLARQPVGA